MTSVELAARTDLPIQLPVLGLILAAERTLTLYSSTHLERLFTVSRDIITAAIYDSSRTMSEYSGVAEATQDVRTKLQDSEIVNHPLSKPVFASIIPEWTQSLSGFEANATVSTKEAVRLEQIETVYHDHEDWLIDTAQQLHVGTLNEHSPARVLFMGLFRDLQTRFASKQNLNPHKLAVLLDHRYK